ncbi:MAG: hypothetical protein EBW14_09640, partial [Oxalobacteraceae bacterium]|nr:hypothetical protein [Oxalobacteraceae bacterium]
MPAEKLTEAAACDWIANALVGQSIQYHEGFLMMDRSDSGSGLSAKERSRLHSVARRMWIACELGLVHLFSLKVADCHYRYLAADSVRITPRRCSSPKNRRSNAAIVYGLDAGFGLDLGSGFTPYCQMSAKQSKWSSWRAADEYIVISLTK